MNKQYIFKNVSEHYNPLTLDVTILQRIQIVLIFFVKNNSYKQ